MRSDLATAIEVNLARPDVVTIRPRHGWQGCIELLDRYGVEIAGKRAVVIGRSNIVGIPISMLLMHRDATVTMAHSKTVALASVVSHEPSLRPADASINIRDCTVCLCVIHKLHIMFVYVVHSS